MHSASVTPVDEFLEIEYEAVNDKSEETENSLGQNNLHYDTDVVELEHDKVDMTKFGGND